MRDMTENADDLQWETYLNKMHFPVSGIYDRKSVQELIDAISHVLIPVVPNSMDDGWGVFIPRGSYGNPEDRGEIIIYCLHKSYNIFKFEINYNDKEGDYNYALQLISDYSTKVIKQNGIKYYQLTDRYTFVILINDFALIAQSMVSKSTPPEEQLEKLLQYSFVRLDGSPIVINQNDNVNNSVQNDINILPNIKYYVIIGIVLIIILLPLIILKYKRSISK